MPSRALTWSALCRAGDRAVRAKLSVEPSEAEADAPDGRSIADVNRSQRTDSGHSLDVRSVGVRSWRMRTDPRFDCDRCHLLERVDRGRNAYRYYVLSIEPSLFGDVTLVREWGRIGGRGRRSIGLHPDERAAREELSSWLARKVRRGYLPRG